MAIPIPVKDLLLARRVESTRIEYKANWNPEKVLHSICAFANDIDNTGGGYIVLGVAEKDGRPILPPQGLQKDSVDAINKELVRLCKLLEPVFLPVVEPVEYDGVELLVIWVPGGYERPYKAPIVIAKDVRSEKACYIRKMANTLRATVAEEKELYSLAGNIPFDDRPNPRASVNDLRRGLFESYLTAVESDLASTLFDRPIRDVANDMMLLSGAPEAERPRNVALLFFNEAPERFFPLARIDIVDKPDPTGQGMREKIIKGPIDRQLSEALAYIRNMFVKEIIFKDPNDEHAIRHWNYPYAAIEEALANAVFHKSYAISEPVTVVVTPEAMEITSVPGPDRSIRDEDLRAHRMVARRSRNRRIWEFLKELELVEGRNTGIPTIVRTMKENGSPEPIFLTDEDRTYFTIVLPIHPDFLNKETELIKASDLNDSVGKPVIMSSDEERSVLINAVSRTLVQNEETVRDSILSRWASILQEMVRDDKVTIEVLTELLGVSRSLINTDIAKLKKLKLVRREGSLVSGKWIVQFPSGQKGWLK